MEVLNSPDPLLSGAASTDIVDMTSPSALSASISSLSSSMSFELVSGGERPSAVAQEDDGNASSSTSSVLLSGHDSDDEIVWSLSDGEADLLSDSDFVVLSRTRSPVVLNIQSFDPSIVSKDSPSDSVTQLASEFAMLNLTAAANQRTQGKKASNGPGAKAEGLKVKKSRGKKKREKKMKEGTVKSQTTKGKSTTVTASMAPQTDPSSPPTGPLSPVHEARLHKSTSTATLKPSRELGSPASGKNTKARPKKKKKKKSAAAPAAAKAAQGVPSAPAGTDAKDERKDSPGGTKVSSEDEGKPTPYDEASEYISNYISNPEAHQDKTCHLTLLQSVIVELGLLSDPGLLPRTLTAAKRFIKSHAFLNIKDYTAKRGNGQAALKSILFPSRSALVKDLRKKRNFASLAWVKKNGLQDLLVSAFYH